MDLNIPQTMLTQPKQMAPITVRKECSSSSLRSFYLTQIDKVAKSAMESEALDTHKFMFLTYSDGDLLYIRKHEAVCITLLCYVLQHEKYTHTHRGFAWTHLHTQTYRGKRK